MGKIKGFIFRYRAFTVLVGGAILLSTLFQNCAEKDFDLSLLDPQGTAFSSNSDYDLQAPLIAKKVDRYVFLVDMSFSMVSGPCPQDVDANMIFKRGEFGRQTVNAWDPNKRLKDRSQTQYQQVAAYDCYVDPDMGPEAFSEMPYLNAKLTSFEIVQNSTIVGSDFEGHRLSVVKQWVQQLRANLSAERRNAAKIIIVPFTSGKAMERLLGDIRFEFRFHDIDEPEIDHLIEDLERVHETTREKAANEENFHRWKDRAMGSSSPTEVMDRLYQVFFEDMNILNGLGVLRKTTYNFFILSDGMLTPVQEQVDLAVRTHYLCAECVEGEDCPNTCKEIREAIEEAVGDPSVNNRTMLAIKFGKIQGLTEFYGAGRIRNHFIQVNQDYSDLVYKDFDSLFEILSQEYKKYHYKFSYWSLLGDRPPFNLATSPVEYQNYSLTGLIILNPNLRVGDDGKIHYDSDADGLFDKDEERYGLDPLNPRTAGACLDSIAVHPAYAEKCRAILKVPDCDTKLDTDMDSLNECEERMLGTNPYDFDTDDDLIPDYFEWVYNYNPILSDKNKDTNGDGATNLNGFLSGLGPNHNKENIQPSFMPHFRLTERVTDRQEEDIWISQFSLELDSIPFGAGTKFGEIPVTDTCLLYHTRNLGGESGCSAYGIHQEDMLYQVNPERSLNIGVALLRLRDKDNDDNLVWKIMKFDITDSSEGKNIIDLGQFRDFDVLDEAGD